MIEPFPPPNFVPTRSVVEGIELYKPAPQVKTVPPHQSVMLFNCPQCGGRTGYSASDGGLTCTHCGYYQAPQQAAVGRQATSFEFRVEMLQRAAHGWGGSRKRLDCQNCGSHVSVPPKALTHTCAFCGSNKVIQREAPQEVLRPRFLVPLTIQATECQKIFREWLGNNWLTPRSLQQLASLKEFTAIYLPFWTFNATSEASWKAQVGHKRYKYGDDDSQNLKWKDESGRVKKTFNDLLIIGTEHIKASLLSKIIDYDLNDLVRYDPSFLAGLQAQAYEVPLESAWEKARHQMREKTRQDCRHQASTYHIRNFSMTLDFADESWRYILLPVYVITYHYKNIPYQVVINGQTGSIAGSRPIDLYKILKIAALFVLFCISAIMLDIFFETDLTPLAIQITAFAFLYGMSALHKASGGSVDMKKAIQTLNHINAENAAHIKTRQKMQDSEHLGISHKFMTQIIKEQNTKK